MINFLIALWAWFNGKKTVIGAVCFWVATILIPGLFVNTWHWTYAWIPVVIDTLMWIAGVLTPIGILHKAAKRPN